MDREEIRRIRNALGMTQEEFAHELGVTSVSVSRWEIGKVKPSRLAVRSIQALARRAGIPHTQQAA